MADLYTPAFIHDYDIEITQNEDFALGFRCMPRTDQAALYLEDTTGYSAILSIFAPDPSGTEILTVDHAGGEIALGFTPGKVARSTAYGVGQKVVPLALNGYVYECTVAGTSHASTEPTWPTTLGNTVTDGTVTWRCETDDSLVCNVYINLGTDITGVLTPWGRGSYALTVKDTYNHSFFYVDGAAYLRQASYGAVG